MGNLFAYNVTMATLPVAYFLAASAVVLSTRVTPLATFVAALLYVGAFSIYQSVVANAASIFAVWMLVKLLSQNKGLFDFLKEIWRPVMAATISVICGGGLYIAIVLFMDIKFDDYQAAGEAFSLNTKSNIWDALTGVIDGTRAFFIWPENYFPGYLKKLQLLLVASAALVCIWLPKDLFSKVTAAVLFVLVVLSPRIVQFIHPQGTYHSNALTAYAVTIAGCVMIIIRATKPILRNTSAVLTMVLLGGYIVQCNWISTVNYLNTLAHYTALTQILTRVKSLPSKQWDGRNVFIVGSYKMRPDYPYKRATGVATTYLDAPHINHEDYVFTEADETTPAVLQYSKMVSPWPNSDSVSVFAGSAIVVLSNRGE
jgi:hypothetical protein